jgi:DNA-binding CsgD family transcriptional regulator
MPLKNAQEPEADASRQTLWSCISRLSTPCACDEIGQLLGKCSAALGFMGYAYRAQFHLPSGQRLERVLTDGVTVLAECVRTDAERLWQLDLDVLSRQWKCVVTGMDGTEQEISGLSIAVTESTLGQGTFVLWPYETQACDFDAGSRLPELAIAHLVASRALQALQRVLANECVAQHRLTMREQQCLRWIARGKSSWEIAAILGITQNTVIYHVRNILSKLNVSTRHQAVAHAAMLGLLRPEGQARQPGVS